MNSYLVRVLLVATAATLGLATAAEASPQARTYALFPPEGEPAKPPKGWTDFCKRYTADCTVKASAPRDIELTETAWESIVGANKWVNAHIKPVTDQKHWGVAERWDYAEDGYGDCEDYALLKRRILIEVGYPREALLMTVVWANHHTEGHAVLIVRTNKGEFVLDNKVSDVLLWSKTSYDFVKRQTQSDPNAWIYIDGLSPQKPVAASVSVSKKSTKHARSHGRYVGHKRSYKTAAVP